MSSVTMERLGVRPYMFEPVSDEDGDFEEQPFVSRLQMDASEWYVFFKFFFLARTQLSRQCLYLMKTEICGGIHINDPDYCVTVGIVWRSDRFSGVFFINVN